MNSPKVSAHPQGVIVRFGTESKRSEIEAMAEACRNGTCGCQMPGQMESIEVTGEDGSVAVVVSGQNLDPAKFQEAVAACGCGG